MWPPLPMTLGAVAILIGLFIWTLIDRQRHTSRAHEDNWDFFVIEKIDWESLNKKDTAHGNRPN